MIDFFSTNNWVAPERGDLLISEPFLPDQNFERTVILICEHDADGTFGFVINRPSNSLFGDLIEEASGFDAEVYVGGPVQTNTLHFIHRAQDQIISGKKVREELHWGGDFEKLLRLINTAQIRKKDYRFFAGYSGWSPGQLEEELKAHSWIIYKNPSDKLIFDIAPDMLWKTVLDKMGGKFRMMSNYPMDPRLN